MSRKILALDPEDVPRKHYNPPRLTGQYRPIKLSRRAKLRKAWRDFKFWLWKVGFFLRHRKTWRTVQEESIERVTRSYLENR